MPATIKVRTEIRYFILGFFQISTTIYKRDRESDEIQYFGCRESKAGLPTSGWPGERKAASAYPGALTAYGL
jgi:hypothetical protein